MSGEGGQPWVWGEAKHLGTAQEEFDIATGYWKKWQRCEEEKAELLKALERHLNRLGVFSLKYDTSEGNVKVDYEWLKQPLVEAIAKAERP